MKLTLINERRIEDSFMELRVSSSGFRNWSAYTGTCLDELKESAQ